MNKKIGSDGETEDLLSKKAQDGWLWALCIGLGNRRW